MLAEARDSWVTQARQARLIGLQLSNLINDMKDYATANGLTELIQFSIADGSATLLGTDMQLSDVLAYVALADAITLFLDDPVVEGGLSRRLFMRKIG